MAFFLPQLALLLALLATARAQIFLHAAGPLAEPARRIYRSATVNPCNFPDGLNIQCRGRPTDRRAIFQVNGVRTRVARRAPFFLLGKRPNFVQPWTPPAKSIRIVCKLESTTYAVSIRFTDCTNRRSENAPAAKATPRPRTSPSAAAAPPTAMYFRAAGRASSATRQVQVTSGVRFCPQRDVGSSLFTVLCAAPRTTTRALFRLNGSQVRFDPTAPFLVAGENAQGPLPWRDAPRTPFSLSCLAGANAQVFARDILVSCETPKPLDTSACVVLPATVANVDPNAPGWFPDAVLKGMTFNAGNLSKELVPAGESAMTFDFVAPATSRFAVVLDMTTRGRADYNDVYMRFVPRGLQRMRGDSVSVARSWTKGYHSFFGRGAKVSSQVDHTPHSISTAEVLKKGQAYQFGISGRSNQVTIHNVLLFPCEAGGCERKTLTWKPMQEACLPGSTLYTPKPRPVAV